MDKFYSKNFSDYARQQIQVVDQVLPMYLDVLGSSNGGTLLPGEGLEFERYGSVSLGLGPGLSLLGGSFFVHPSDIGIFANAQALLTIVRGHFRTTMEVQENGLLHVTLERINQDSETLEAEVDAGITSGAISYAKSLMRLEASVIHTRDTLLDLVFDPNIPQAKKALYEAYAGIFNDAQTLAASADTNYQGVRSLARPTELGETTHERDLQFFTYDRGSSTAQITAAGDDDLAIDEMNEHRNTIFSQQSIDISIDTDLSNSDPETNRSMSLKFKFTSGNATPEEVTSFINIAQTFASPEQQSEVSKWSSRSMKGKQGRFEGYFYVGFDPKDLSDLFKNPDQKIAASSVSWARSLGIPNPENWATLSEAEQDAVVSTIPDAPKHLKAFRKLTDAIQKAVVDQSQGTGKSDARTGHFISTIRGVDFDLYPIGAIAQNEDRNHQLTLERFTLGGNPATQETFQYSAIGSDYVFPKKTVY
jgi:hypothetical protein